VSDSPIRVKVDPLLAEIVPKFLERCTRTAPELRDAVRSGDLDAARRIGHVLHGTASSLGFEEMAGIGRKIEQVARDGDSEALAKLADALEKHVSRVQPEYG